MEPELYTLRRKGRGLVQVSPQQQRTAYGKCPSYLTKTVMSSERNMHFHTLSPVLHVCVRVTPPVHVVGAAETWHGTGNKEEKKAWAHGRLGHEREKEMVICKLSDYIEIYPRCGV
ncbi:hypothetical protein NQZ68_020395 [Dissostichus eleginoides]|nr:hypothetical protein NQZ68_020395 [Dissostichus eleginoides]